MKSEKKVSKKKESKPYQSEYKKLARLTSDAALESDIMNLEMRLQGTFTQDSLLVLQNSYEYSSLSSEVTEKDTTCRYLPTRIIDSSFKTRPESEADIFIYQYVSSFDKQVEHALNHADIFLDDTDAISSFLEDTVLRIPVKPKLDIVSKVRKEADQWQLQFANHWYPIQDVQIRLASPSITPQSPSVKCDTELLRDLYYDKSPLYMRNAISRTIFDVLSDFVKHDKQWLIFEGVPALGKDAYTKQFLMSLKQSSLQLYTQEISSSPDQSLLEQVMDIYEAHKHEEIMLQVSEINLISPAQLITTSTS